MFQENEKIRALLSKEVQDFVRQHGDDDVRSLLLRRKTIQGVPAAWIAEQISGRKKAETKLPEYHRTKNIIYPPQLNLEQCSSEATAIYKAERISADFGGKPGNGADLTGGFGIDSLHLSRKSRTLHYVEPDPDVSSLAGHNHALLGAENIEYHNETAEEFLSHAADPLDFIYVDPSRRIKSSRTFRLADATPDSIRLSPGLLRKARWVWIKASPYYDIQMGLRELKNVRRAEVVAVGNECKELLFALEKDFAGEPMITAVDLNPDGSIRYSFSFTSGEEKNSIVPFAEPAAYLYEPGAALMKAGAFRWIAAKFQLSKLAPSTHLYTSENAISGFPGRVFRILRMVKLSSKLNTEFKDGVNVISRSHPLTVEQIRKKTGLKDGGENYLICTSSKAGAIAIVADRLSFKTA